MKKYRAVFISLISLLFSCSNNSIIDSKITIPIASDQLQKIEKTYPGFINCYTTITNKRSELNEQDFQTFGNLTYREVYDYLNFISSNRAKIDDEIKEEWQSYYGDFPNKLDSLHNCAVNWWEDNKLESKVKVEIYKVLPNDPEDPYMSFKCKVKVKNQSGKNIDNIDYVIGLCDSQYPLGYLTTNVNEIQNLTDEVEAVAFSSSYGYTWTKDRETLLKCSTKDLYEKYRYEYQIVSIVQDGVEITNESLKNSYPHFEMLYKELWNTNCLAKGREEWLNKAVKEVFDIDYVPFKRYYDDNIEVKLRNINPFIYDFLTYNPY